MPLINKKLTDTKIRSIHIIKNKMNKNDSNITKADDKCTADVKYQLDAKIVVYYHKISLHVLGIYMPIFRSAGCILLRMVFSSRCSGCNPERLACSPVHCV
jgi:hypothetical protein